MKDKVLPRKRSAAKFIEDDHHDEVSEYRHSKTTEIPEKIKTKKKKVTALAIPETDSQPDDIPQKVTKKKQKVTALPNPDSDAGTADKDNGGAVGAATGCSFAELDMPKKLNDAVLAGITALGFNRTTPVQQATIPLLLSNKDVAVQACTGSGKTAAFLVPAFELLLRAERWRPHDVGAIVIAPTRELSSQIYSVARIMADHVTGVVLISLTGGSDPIEAVKNFRDNGGNLVIATPGRLEHTMASEGSFNVKKLELLILDEADRLLDMGFQACLNSILARLPKQRRTGLFSATMSTEVTALARAGLRNPRMVKVTVKGMNQKQQATPVSLTNAYMLCDPRKKLSQLVHFLNEHREEKCMLYVLTCAYVDYFGALLPQLPGMEGVDIMSLHGKMVQKRRSKTYEKFMTCSSGVLLCTDVAARGLDIPDVDWIVQYDAPQDPSFYVHRVGRTARFGRGGKSLLILAPTEDTYINFLTVRNVPLHELHPATQAADVLPAALEAVRQDLDLHEKGQRAFVSFVRAYKEHQCNFIFQLDKVDLGGAAMGMALLRLPKMPELRGPVPGFRGDPGAVAGLRYKDPIREKARVARDKVKAAKAQEDHEDDVRRRTQRVKNLPWSGANKLTFKQGVGVCQGKAGKKRVPGVAAGQDEEGEGGGDDSDDAEMMREAQLIKKLKRGKISEQQFKQLAGEGWSDSDE